MCRNGRTCSIRWTDTAAKEDPDEQADKLAKKAKTPDEIDEEHAKLKENLTRAIPRQRQPTRKSLAAAEKRKSLNDGDIRKNADYTHFKK